LNLHESLTHSGFEEESSLIGSFESSRVQVFCCRWRNQSYQWLHNDSQRRMDSKLVQVNRKHYCWWYFSNNREGEYYKTLAHASWTHERARSSSPT